MKMTGDEKAIMLLVTGITNFACFPALYVVYQKGLIYQFYMGLFTFATSFMYHSLESVDWNSFYIDRGTWHKLDNIGSICCFIMLFIYWMDNLSKKNGSYYSKHVSSTDLQLNMTGLFITMLMQANHPWRLQNTLIPIFLFLALFILKICFIRKPRYNSYYVKRGTGLLLVAVFFFIRGLDEHKDYLRINHGMWHCFVGFSSFYLWQSIDKDRSEEGKIVKCQYQPRFQFWTVIKKLFMMEFFTDESQNIHKIY